MDFAEGYKKFISLCKTERECVDEFERMAKEDGFVDIQEIIKKGKTLKAGDRVYANNMGKTFATFVIGKEDIEKGMNIVGAHLDSPRIDLKQNPMYQDTDFVLLDTHYYGGVKKYQWVTIPLALHGVIVKKDGTVVKVNVGEKAKDPIFMITDLLVHLSADQMAKTAAKVIEGESLDLLIGSIPGPEKDADDKDIKERVKANILKMLEKEYKIEEEDFLSAELECRLCTLSSRARGPNLCDSLLLFVVSLDGG